MTSPSAPGGAALATAFFTALGHQDWDHLRALCDSDYVHHAPRVPAATLQEYLATARSMFTAFPDLTATLQDVIDADEHVTVRYRCHGTHRGPFATIAPTGRPVDFTALALLRLHEGRIREGWFEFDTGGLLQQLTAAPAQQHHPR